MYRRLVFLKIVIAVLFFLVVAKVASQAMKPETIVEQTATSTIQETPANAPRSTSTLSLEVERLVNDAAIRYGINQKRFLETAKCESSLRPKVIGDDGESYGLWQIHLISHPSVTKEQAFDPIWSTEWAAEKFKKDPTIWTCYRKLYP